jgi:hypothetical protein
VVIGTDCIGSYKFNYHLYDHDHDGNDNAIKRDLLIVRMTLYFIFMYVRERPFNLKGGVMFFF